MRCKSKRCIRGLYHSIVVVSIWQQYHWQPCCCHNPHMVCGYDLCIHLQKWCCHVVISCCTPCSESDLRSQGQVLRQVHFPTSDYGRIWQHGYKVRHRTCCSQHCLQQDSCPRYSHRCYSNVYRRQQQCIHTVAIDALLGGCHLCGRSPVSANTQWCL